MSLFSRKPRPIKRDQSTLRGSHLGNFMACITVARLNAVKVAISKPCFDLWLLLHHSDHRDVLNLKNATPVGGGHPF
jgi:hypothetical protein